MEPRRTGHSRDRDGRRAWVALGVAAALLVVKAGEAGAQRGLEWPIHSPERPRPPVVQPGPGVLPVPAPADAIVLFFAEPVGVLVTLFRKNAREGE